MSTYYLQNLDPCAPTNCDFTEYDNVCTGRFPVSLCLPSLCLTTMSSLATGGTAILTLTSSNTFKVVSSPSPDSGIPWIIRLHLLEYCSRLSHSLCRSSTCSSNTAILLSLLSSCDVRPAIAYVSVSSLSDSACWYNADFSFRTTWSSLSSSRNLSSITSVSQTLLSVTLEIFLALGMRFHQL